MMYSEWVKMNVLYENRLLARIIDHFGIKSEQYKKKVKQIEDLKNGN